MLVPSDYHHFLVVTKALLHLSHPSLFICHLWILEAVVNMLVNCLVVCQLRELLSTGWALCLSAYSCSGIVLNFLRSTLSLLILLLRLPDHLYRLLTSASVPHYLFTN